MMKHTRFTHRLLASVLALLVVTLAGCAQSAPPFTPPKERPVLSSDKPWPSNKYMALGYHAIQDGVADQTYLAVRTDQLISQLNWLHQNGYQAVSVEQILAANKGGQPLPSKAVLLSFDDGYRDFYTRVIPLLRSFNWPAIVAPVGNWLLTPENEAVNFGDVRSPRTLFLNTAELKQVARSSLVEIGAHTFNSHMGSLANPQGNLMPRMANHLWLPEQNRYENSEEFKRRIREDVRAITQTVTETTGRKPRVWVWPYGRASGEAQQIIREEGYELFLTLEHGLADVKETDNVPRILMSGRDSIQSVARRVLEEERAREMKVIHIDLDYVYDPSPEQQNRNLDVLVQRVADMGVNTIFLQAFSDTDGDGLVKEVYFPNRVLPMRADLFNRVAWQLTSRAGVEVYAWMPVMSVALDDSHPRVLRWSPEDGSLVIDPKQYQRLSPFNARNRQAITQLYEDLSRHSSFDGVLFHDDALLSDFEDAGPDALKAYAQAGLPADLATIRGNPKLMQQWTRFKSKALVDFTLELTKTVRSIRGPFVRTARNIFAAPILNPQAEEWFAQNPDDFLAAYDWTAPMAMPYMEGVSRPEAQQWLNQLVDKMAQRPNGLAKSVFEFQARDWRKSVVLGTHTDAHGRIDSKVIADWMRQLQVRGAKNFGYYPDDFNHDHPAINHVRPQMSTNWYPYP